ncbi:acyltransferase [Psychromonas ossibalaenae]|uniref:acyltransferase n=1 Tax=Psychromonas ossibalaenae TaxID=444922 RepID=UPI00036D95C3|nr:acyltransferase family protein [Psychromonas ossibalaenae]
MHQNKISSIELGRLLAIIAIIFIHTRPFITTIFGSGEDTSFGLFLNQISRFAVPLFFIISGYFIAPKLIASPLAHLKIYSLPLLKIWVSWSVIYLLFPINALALSQKGYLAERLSYWDRLAASPLNSLFEGGLVHLWFLPALICAVAIIALLLLTKQVRWLLTIAAVLFIYGVAAGSYQPMTELSAPIFTRNGPFFSTLFVAIGFEIRRREFTMTNIGAWLFIVTGIVIHFCEAYYLTYFGQSFSVHDFLFGTLFWTLGLFMLLLNHPNWGNYRWLQNAAQHSLGIYLVHMLVVIVMMNINGIIQMNSSLASIITPLAAFFVSLALIQLIRKAPFQHLLLR